ncbi:MAG TPA: amino acid adenylation domain-containing protein [Polyangia bacterium]
MPNSASAATLLPQTEGTSLDSQARFVQLPLDLPRSMLLGYEAAALEVVPPAIIPIEGDPRAWWLASVKVLLYRLTHQESLFLDVEVIDGNTDAVSLWQWDEAWAGDESFSTMVARAERTLANEARAPRERGSAANVAIRFVSASTRASRSSIALASGDENTPDLQFVIHEAALDNASAARLELLYNRRLFTAQTIERWLNAFLLALNTAWLEPSQILSRLPLMSLGDLTSLRGLLDGAGRADAAEPFLVSFARSVRNNPAKVAALFRQERLTYGDLDATSSAWAARLQAAGVGPGVRVAVCVPASVDILVAMIAVFKAGGVYVPLDPSHPPALIQGILEECRPRMVLASSKSPACSGPQAVTAPELYEHWYLDLPWRGEPPGSAQVEHEPASVARAEAEGAWDGAAALAARDPSLPAYSLYTSGTTGKPKGVVATHGNLAHYLEVARDAYGFVADDIFCSLARYTFSISLFELLSPLAVGGTLHLLERDEILVPQNLARELASVTVVHAGPSLLSSLFRYLRSDPSAPRSFPRMRHASSGGDMVPGHLLEEMKQVFPNAEIFVIYGCTEISCMGCTFPVSRDGAVEKSFVGRPFPGVGVRLIDAQSGLVPVGVVGEICFRGRGVVDGYWLRPALDDEKFIALEGERYYRTGDLGRVHPDGTVEILGRRDFQVQLRGIRIELAGIENTIRSLGWASQCAVVLKRLDENDARLLAFVVKPKEERVGALRQALAAHLPDYMLPQGMVVLDALPVTANGKVDRQKLQSLPWETPVGDATEKAAPRNAVESRIADAFGRALRVENVGIDDDFFDLGGHSLTAVVLLEELEDILGLSLSPGLLFERSTVRALAEHAAQAFPSAPRPILLAGAPENPPLFLLLGVHIYRPLAHRLAERYSVYSVYAGSELAVYEESAKVLSVSDLARDYIEIIRRQQPHGPYRLAGMSFGGILAFEVAQQLEADGERVVFVGLLDSILPEPGRRRYLAVARRLLSLPRPVVVDVLRRKVRDRLVAFSTQRPTYQFVTHTEDERLRRLEERREDAYRVATQAHLHKIRPWRGEAALVVAGERLAEDPLQSPDCGWSSILANLHARQVDADHLTMLQEPRVEEAAELFLSVLDRADGANRSREGEASRLAHVQG